MDDQGWVPITLIASFPRVSYCSQINNFLVLFDTHDYISCYLNNQPSVTLCVYIKLFTLSDSAFKYQDWTSSVKLMLASMFIDGLASLILSLFSLNFLSISSLCEAKILVFIWIFITLYKFSIALKLLKEAIIGFCLCIILAPGVPIYIFNLSMLTGSGSTSCTSVENLTLPDCLLAAAFFIIIFLLQGAFMLEGLGN